MSQSKGKATEIEEIRRKREVAIVERASKRAIRAEQNRKMGEECKIQGNNLFKEGDYEEAVCFWLHAVEFNGPQPAYMSNLAAAFLKFEDYEKAEELADSALIHDPTFLRARYRRAMARKGLNLLKASIIDLETILRVDPGNQDARSELTTIRKRWEDGEGDETGNTTSDDEFPGPDEEKWEIQSVSDSSDCHHEGNGIPCRFYNRDGCLRGYACSYSHAPDDKSIRDKLGRNVCLFYLMRDCKFGREKCVYSHDKTHLPNNGWWNDEQGVSRLKALLDDCAEQARESLELDWFLRTGTLRDSSWSCGGGHGRRGRRNNDRKKGGVGDQRRQAGSSSSGKGGRRGGGPARGKQARFPGVTDGGK